MLEPFNIQPYTQTVYWTRKEGPIGEFHVYTKASRSINFLDYTTTITENSKVA